MSNAILTAVRTHIPNLSGVDDPTVLALSSTLLRRLDDDGIAGWDAVIEANPTLDPDAIDTLMHLSLYAIHGAQANAVFAEATGAEALRSALANTPQE